MDNAQHISFNASDRSYLAILKKDLKQLISQTDFSANKRAELDIIIAEMASNLVKHGGGGEMLFRLYKEGTNEVIELISIDNGPGIADVGKMMEDGMSTTNTLGQGLGAIKRLSDVCDVYSIKDWGTIVLSRVYKHELPHHRKKPVAEVRSIVLPKPGEKVCGDSYSAKLTNDTLRLFLGDGLGHGPEAHKAVIEAVKAFRLNREKSPVEMLQFMHTSVKKTRGLVGTIVMYDFNEKKWLICGIGNIMARVHNSFSGKNFLSYNGIIGMNIPTTMKDQTLDHEHGQIMVLCSDGIKTRWENQKYPAIFRHDLSIFAAALYKDFARKTDDMSVVVCRIN
ncbi:MAG: SpoIIE family protein phosphatase [Flavipsychrobacter sp.]|jgi:anti-sigma regulatory factor (Ser/Thr protein kinase)|nr:SpoIIE family protein phosphatase [Flavipsychrobacter sp.]